MTNVQLRGPMWVIDDIDADSPPCTADCPCPLCRWNSEREAELLALHPVCEEDVTLTLELVPCSVCGVPCGDGLHDACAATIGDSVELPAA